MDTVAILHLFETVQDSVPWAPYGSSFNYSTNINKLDKLPVNDYKETQYSISCFDISSE
jgi:hypothetical protein